MICDGIYTEHVPLKRISEQRQRSFSSASKTDTVLKTRQQHMTRNPECCW